MAKHRRQTTNTAVRTAAAATAVVAGATLMVPTTAQAAEVRVPNSPVSAQIPGIENIPGIANIPGLRTGWQVHPAYLPGTGFRRHPGLPG